MSKNSSNIVYVVQDPNGKEIIEAKQYGELRVLLTGRESHEEATTKLQLALSRIKDIDYMLPIGNPRNIGIAVHFALLYNDGCLNLLMWDRQTYSYNTERITVNESDKPSDAATAAR